jgi:hypothetical protein
VLSRTIQPVEEMRAAGAWPFALGSEHEAVDRERVLAVEQLGQAHRPVGTFEAVVVWHHAARRQGAALGGNALDLAAQRNLLLQQGVAHAPVLGALVGEMKMFHVVRTTVGAAQLR